MPWRKPIKKVWANMAVVALLLATLSTTAGYVANTHRARENRKLIVENGERIADIQQARIFSCQTTYEGIRQVLRIFARPKNQRTAKEQRDIDKFNRRVDQLKRGCGVQTGVRP